MQGSKPSKKGRKHWVRVVGTSAAILVVAGGVGIPFDLAAAILLGAALVLVVDP